jgi:hypothetical protein
MTAPLRQSERSMRFMPSLKIGSASVVTNNVAAML